MTCSKCGYMMGTFDKECVRCKSTVASAGPQASTPQPVAVLAPAISLLPCPACQQMVSSQANACPKCGQPIAPQVAYASVGIANSGIINGGNGSGIGATAVLPIELRGFNMGAFWLSWLWAISNNTWMGLLALIPYVGIIMWFVLGLKGNEWAWQNRKWESVEQFKQVQAIWARSGLITFVVFTVLGVLGVILQFTLFRLS